MLGQPAYLPAPIVVGVRFHGALPAGSTATDLVLTLTEMLRKHGVSRSSSSFAATGCRASRFPTRDHEQHVPRVRGDVRAVSSRRSDPRYLEITGRSREQIDLVERYTKEQGLFRTDGDTTPKFSELLELDLTKIEPSLAGPKRPQDRVSLPRVWESFTTAFWQRPQTEP